MGFLVTHCEQSVLTFHDHDLVRGGRRSKVAGRHGAKGASSGADEEEHVGALVADALKVLSVESSVKSRTSFGGTAPKNVMAQAKAWAKRLEKERKLG
jgi:argininosuccinate lyase